MDLTPGKPELSIIVPVLNEAGTIRGFLRNLAEQKGVDFEVLICDGGSSDGTPDNVMETAPHFSFPVRIIRCEKGRGRQMNRGAAAACGSFLLFLHADSLFRDVSALRKALDALASAMAAYGHERVAGRFALRFRLKSGTSSLFYYCHESKARLNRAGCIHGDQGFLVGRAFFRSVGPFEECAQVLEDTLFAESVRQAGHWILFPGEIFTSARRFETEGLAEREVLNAVLMTLSAAGRADMLMNMPRLYSEQYGACRLRLFPFLRGIRRLVGGMPFRRRLSFWNSCGDYALENSWQLAFALDAARNFRSGIPPGEGRYHNLERFDRRIRHATRNRFLYPWAALLVWIWFHVLFAGRYLMEKYGNTYR